MSSMPPRIPFTPSSAFAAVFNVTRIQSDRSDRSDRTLRAVTSAAARIPGVTSVYVDPPTGEVAVAAVRPLDDAAVAAVIAVIAEAGYRVARAA